MDFVAMELLSSAMGSVNAAGHPGSGFPFPDGHLQTANTLHAARYVAQRERAWSHRQIGRSAASRLLNLLTRLPDTMADPKSLFMHLSLTLNTSQIPHEERDAFARNIHGILGRGSAVAQLVPTLGRFFLRRDPEELLERVSAIG